MNEFSKLVWLKRTDGHKFTGAEFRVLVSIFNHSGSDGRKSHPGIKLMMSETGYGKAAISTAVSALKARGWIRETFKGSGISGSASVFELVPDAPNPPSSSPTGEQPSEGSSSSEDEQPTRSSSPTADSSSPTADRVVRLEWTPSDPGTDPRGSDPLGGPFDRPSDPGEVRYPPNHLRSRVETDARSLRLAGTDKTAELSVGRPGDEGLPPLEDEPRSESESFPSLGLNVLTDSEGMPRDSGDPTDPFSAAFNPEAVKA